MNSGNTKIPKALEDKINELIKSNSNDRFSS